MDLYHESLWDRAYEELFERDSRLVKKYEELLNSESPTAITAHAEKSHSRIYEIWKWNSPRSKPVKADIPMPSNYKHAENRRAQLDTIIQRGLERMKQHEKKFAIAGHVIKDEVANAATLLQKLSGFVAEAVKASPEASLAWAGVCLILPLLINSSLAEKANQDGFIYVTSRMRFYTALEPLLLPRDRSKSVMSHDLQAEVELDIVNLYREILNFQIQSVLRFFRLRFEKAFRDTIRHEEWEKMLDEVKRLENIVRNDFKDINDATTIAELDRLSGNAELSLATMQKQLDVSERQLDIITDQLNEQKKFHQFLLNVFGSPIVVTTVSASPSTLALPEPRGIVAYGTMSAIKKHLVDGSNSGWTLVDDFPNPDGSPANAFIGGKFMANYPGDPATTLYLTIPSSKGNNRADWVVEAPNSTYYPGKHAGHLILLDFPFRPPAVYWDTPILSPYPRCGEFSGELGQAWRGGSPWSLLRVVQRMASIILESPKDGGDSDLPGGFAIHGLSKDCRVGYLRHDFLMVDEDWLRQCTQFFCRAFNKIDVDPEGSNVLTVTRSSLQDGLELITDHHRTMSVLAINSFIDHILVGECNCSLPFTVNGLSAEEYFAKAATIQDWIDGEEKWAQMLNEMSGWVVSQNRGGEDRNSYYSMN